MKPIAREGVEYHKLEDGAVLYDTDRDRVHTLNVTAALLWNFCDGCYGLEEMAVELTEAGDVPLEKAREDAARTVEFFRKEGLLRR